LVACIFTHTNHESHDRNKYSSTPVHSIEILSTGLPSTVTSIITSPFFPSYCCVQHGLPNPYAVVSRVLLESDTSKSVFHSPSEIASASTVPGTGVQYSHCSVDLMSDGPMRLEKWQESKFVPINMVNHVVTHCSVLGVEGRKTRCTRLEHSLNSIAFVTPCIARRRRQPERQSIESRIASYHFSPSFRPSSLCSYPLQKMDGVLSSEDIGVGVMIALSLVLLTSSLQNRSESNMGILDDNPDDNEAVVFGADAWKDISKPENYVLYNTKVRNKLENPKLSPPNRGTFRSEKRVVAIALLVLFVPIFSFEFFLALSRQVVCGNGPLSMAGWALELCSPHYEL
jgi:hypothetical protein